MSSIVSRRPSSRNQSKLAFWMSIRLGRSRTCLRREKFLRARGAVTRVVKVRTASLGETAWVCGRTSGNGAEPLRVPKDPLRAQGIPDGFAAGGVRMVARVRTDCQAVAPKAPFGAFGGRVRGCFAALGRRRGGTSGRRARRGATPCALGLSGGRAGRGRRSGGRRARRARLGLEGAVTVRLVRRPGLLVDPHLDPLAAASLVADPDLLGGMLVRRGSGRGSGRRDRRRLVLALARGRALRNCHRRGDAGQE